MELCKKTTYSTAKLAWEDLERIKSITNREKVPKRAYKCKNCGNYHLTSRNNDKDKIKDLKSEIFILKKRLKESDEKLESREKELFKRIDEIKKLKTKNIDVQGTSDLQIKLRKQEKIIANNKKRQKHFQTTKAILNHILNYAQKSKKRNSTYDEFIQMITNNFKQYKNGN